MEINECAFCPRFLDHKAFGLYTKHVGWVRHRKGEGGINAMTLPSDTLALAHRECVDEQTMLIQKQAGKNTMSQMPEEAPCLFCGEQVDGSKMYYSRRIGWLQRKRSGGGANRVALPSEALGFAHVECIETEKGGEVAWGQESLFD